MCPSHMSRKPSRSALEGLENDGLRTPAISYAHAYEMAKVVSWMDRGGDPNNTSFSKQGHTLLMTACVQNNPELVEAILKRGAAVDLKSGGKTALHHAVIFGHPKCVQLLLEHGADPHLRVDEDDSDFTSNDGLTSLEIIELEIEREGLRPYNRDCLRLLQTFSGRVARPAESSGSASAA